ncbi:hypothetical protein HYC85_028847 [Camellia sinensis]|uniref:Uncharacterized protein n=1 Tax=Camellia sinensis TaxID=4442 RepID=A0A7J7G099_CAMSI|nr:hypothetical protein HYC85_028847 [Camellia sinensis]
MVDPFATTTSQPSQNTGPPRNRRTSTPLHMSLARTLKMLMEREHLKPLDPSPLFDPLPPRHDPTQYCLFHQQHGHPTNLCYRLRHKIQDLIDNKIIAPPTKPNVTTTPLPAHNQKRENPPKKGLPDTQVIEKGASLAEEYDPILYIVAIYQPKPVVILPDFLSINIIRGDELGQHQNDWPEQGLNDLAKLEEDLENLEEDLDNLYFFEEEDTGSVQIRWWDPSQPKTSNGWLSKEESNIEEYTRETGKEEGVVTSSKTEAAPLTEKEQALEQFQRERFKAKRTGKQYKLVHKPIWGTLNRCFVCQGEDFPFCGFLEPWFDRETKTRYPGFEIFSGH